MRHRGREQETAITHVDLRHAPGPVTVLKPTPVAQNLELDDPAILVMTDFSYQRAITVGENRHIDAALEDMTRGGVRALLLVRDENVTGLITSYDIQGEHPILFLRSSRCIHPTCLHRDVLVGNIMTPWAELKTLFFEDVRAAAVRNVANIFRSMDLMHILVVESVPGPGVTVHGMFSRTRPERQVGIRLPSSPPGGFAQSLSSAIGAITH